MTLCAAAVTVLALSGCEKLKSRLYPEDGGPVDEAWQRDSAFVVREPRILFRNVRIGEQELLTPIAVLGGTSPRTLRMSKRGWNFLDVTLLNSERTVTPVRNGMALAPVKIRQRMWENASQPLDSIQNCPNMIPSIKAPLTDGAQMAVLNYKLPTDLKMLSAGEVEAAISGIPTLVAPTVGIKGAQLARYKRNVRQVLRKNGPPAVFVEYHDDSERSDTGMVAMRRPRHLHVVMEKGVYGYRPGWTYSTTGAENDRPVLRFLESMDVDADGKSELFFGVDVPGGSYTFAFRQKNDSWVELWKRPPVRCDGR